MSQSRMDALADAEQLRLSLKPESRAWANLIFAGCLPYNISIAANADAAAWYGRDCARAAFRAVPGLRA
jgi:hypothetical protein